ncbi:MAG: hypothetical protein NTX61_04065 [Bacteroidetes bacterium]|nr:hypothetical protein [Bacteroidota bacterium]
MKEIWILGIYVKDRLGTINTIQPILTKFGCVISTRLGLHNFEETDEKCAGCGLILLELTGDHNEFIKLENELLKLDGIEVRKMIFPQS